MHDTNQHPNQVQQDCSPTDTYSSTLDSIANMAQPVDPDFDVQTGVQPFGGDLIIIQQRPSRFHSFDNGNIFRIGMNCFQTSRGLMNLINPPGSAGELKTELQLTWPHSNALVLYLGWIQFRVVEHVLAPEGEDQVVFDVRALIRAWLTGHFVQDITFMDLIMSILWKMVMLNHHNIESVLGVLGPDLIDDMVNIGTGPPGSGIQLAITKFVMEVIARFGYVSTVNGFMNAQRYDRNFVQALGNFMARVQQPPFPEDMQLLRGGEQRLLLPAPPYTAAMLDLDNIDPDDPDDWMKLYHQLPNESYRRPLCLWVWKNNYQVCEFHMHRRDGGTCMFTPKGDIPTWNTDYVRGCGGI